MYPWGRESRAGGTHARYTRAIEGTNVRPLVAFSRLDTYKSGRRGTHGQLVAVLRPPPVRLRGLIPVLLPVRTEGKGRTSEPVRERARDGSRGRRRGNPRRGAIRWKNIRGSRVMGAAGNSHLLALRHRRRHVLLEIRLTLRRVFHLPGEPSREETHRASSRARTALRCTAENESYLPLFVCL